VPALPGYPTKVGAAGGVFALPARGVTGKVAPMENDPSPVRGPATEVEEFAERREFVRRSVLRANRAVAVILAVVVLLGAVMVMMSLRARRNQVRAEAAEREATERLWKASLAQARAEILSTQTGHRAAALEAVRTAAAIRPSQELRNEAVAALGLRDLVMEREWTLRPGAYGLSFDPGLQHYLVRYRESVLSMFRMEDNSLVREFPMPPFLPKDANIGDFMFSATGKYVVIRYNRGGYILWDAATGAMVRNIVVSGFRAFSWPVMFTTDDRFLCAAMKGSDGVHLLYDVEKGELRKVPGVPDTVTWEGLGNLFALSPRGDLLAWYQGAEVTVLDVAAGKVRHTLKAPSVVQSMRWDAQGARLSFTSDNFSVSVLDVESGRVVQMGGKALNAWSLRFSPDGSLLMGSGIDGMTRLWDAATARLLCETSGLLALEFSTRGDSIGGGLPGRTVSVWRIVQPTATQFIHGKAIERATVWQSDLSADGRWLVWAPPGWMAQDGYEVLDLDRGNTSAFVPTPGKVCVGLHPVRPEFWTAGAHGLTFHKLPLYAPPEAAALAEPCGALPLPAGFTPWTASFSADGRYAAVAGTGGAMVVVDTEKPDSPVKLDGRMGMHSDIPGPASARGSGVFALSPDGRWVAGGRETPGANPNVWDARTGKAVVRLKATYAHLAFSPDSRWLVTVGTRTARLWSTASWEPVWNKARPELLSNYGAAAFSGDGSLVAWTQDVDRIELVAPSTGELLTTINAARLGIVTGLRFSADGRKLFAGGAEGKLMVLDVVELRKQLASMNLDWPLPASAAPAPAAGTNGFAAWAPVLLGLVPAGLAAILGTLVLLRQSRLTSEFVHATEVAARRTQELAAEREVSELKSRFVTTVSHEFRTPLGITMSAIELIRHYEDRLPPAEKQQLYQDIHTSTRNMAALMEQVLVLGRVDAGKLAYRPAPLDLDTLARKLTDESLSATHRKCPVAWTAENDLSGARADEALLRHIFSNLLSNAVKYSPEESPVAFTGRREGKTAVFTVQDRGIGIPEKDLPHLFEAFHRGGNVGDIPGTGLGLVIIKRCVDLHAGTVSVSTKAGEGSTFTVRLPMWNGS
jgi:signal transduction histidine kinase